ncbi:MAG: tyrosine-protein phosphatase [Bacilli bacterium]|nr:tyrosine-protein phosphatase [Bacilli bacterium]
MKYNKKLLTVLSLGFLVLSACGESDKKPDNPKPTPVAPEYFDEVTEFDDVVDMHTPEQKAFVDYKAQGNYENLTKEQLMTLTGQNSGGTLNLSAPKGIEISFTHDEDEDIESYALEVSKDKEFNSGVFKYTAGKTATKITAYNLEIGQKYYYRLSTIDAEGDVIDYSHVRELETANIAPRNLYVDGMTNCRDLGGRTTARGGVIKQNLLFRTAALDDSMSGSIVTAAGKEVLKSLNLKTEIELRGGPTGDGGTEAKSQDKSAYGEGMDINFKFVPFAYENGKNLLFRNIEPVRKVFDVLGDTSNYPVFFHCRIGTDRTGLIALLVNALLGVELQDIFQDYLFSDFGCIGKVPTVGQANEDSIAEYVEELRAFPGEKLHNKVYNFLRTAGIPAQKLDNMINFLTEGEDAETTEVKRVDCQTVDKMTTTLPVTTVDITTNPKSSTRQPAQYVTFNAANQKVTYTFNSDKAFTADLYANLCSKTTSGTLANAFTVKVNGTAIDVETTSFATKALGFDSKIECYIPSKLGSISVNAGANTIEIESKGSTSIKMSQFAFSSMSAPANITVAA